MSQMAVYVSPPPTAPLIHEPQPNLLRLTDFHSTTMFDRQSASILGTYAGADLRPLRTPKREKGRVTVKNAPWNWGRDSEMHPYLLSAASSSVLGVDRHRPGSYPKEPHSATEPRRRPPDELAQPLRRLPPGRTAPPPSEHVHERIFFNEAPPLGNPPLTPHPVHKRARSRTFTSAHPSSFADPTNPKSRSETLGKHRSKITLHPFQLLVAESADVVDTEEDRRPGFYTPTTHAAIQRPEPGFSESPVESTDLDLVVIPPPPRTPPPRIPTHEPPSPASSSSPHSSSSSSNSSPHSSSPHSDSDPGYDSDSNSTAEAKAGDHVHVDQREEDDAGFDSDDAFCLPGFYRDLHETLGAVGSVGTIGSIGTIGSVGTAGTVGTVGTIGSIGTVGTVGTMGSVLGPAQRPTVRGIRARVASVGKSGGVVMTERRTLNVGIGIGIGSGTGNGHGSVPKRGTVTSLGKAEPTKARVYPDVDGLGEEEGQPEGEREGVLRPKDRSSSLAVSTNILGMPSSQASPATNVRAQRPHSSAVVGGNDDVHGSPLPTKVDTPASNAQPPPRPPRRVHRVPPPLILQPPALPTKTPEAQLALTPKSSTSFQFPPPPTPLSPAHSFMSSMSALSTVSTIAAVMLNRPKSKQPRISEKERRRRRFLKLTKTLGEDVPPELVSVKAAAPGRSRTISFGARGKVGASRDERGAGRRESVGENGKGGGGRVRKKRRDSFDGRRTAGARRSVAVSPLEANFPSILEGYGRYYDEPLPPISPDVLRKYPSSRRRGISNPDGGLVSEPFSVNPTPALSPEPEEHGPPVVTPYFEDHPFRLVVDESSPTPAAAVPRFVSSDSTTTTSQPRKATGSGPRAAAGVSEGGDERGSSYSMNNNPWMRSSLALPLSYDPPFIEYALPCGVDRKVAESRVGVGHHRRMSSLDVVSPRCITSFEPLSDDTQVQYRSSRDVGAGGHPSGGGFSVSGGLRRLDDGAYLDVPREVGGDEGEWENWEWGVYRRERRQGWSGEWNQLHIQTVIEKLRQL